MPVIEVEWDSRDLGFFRGSETDRGLARALRNAGNGALRSLQKESIVEVQRRKALPEQRITRGLKLVFPSGRDRIESLQWTQRVSGEPIPLVEYGHTAGRSGVSVRVNAMGGSKLIRSAFVAKMGSGHLGIFKRSGKKRLPIKELFTSRLSNVIDDPNVAPVLLTHAQAKIVKAFPKALERQIKRMRSKGKL